MNASDPPPSRALNRRLRTLILRRQDHFGDPLGLAFLETPESAGQAILDRLHAYLGDSVKILRADVSHDQIEVAVESRGWPEEAARLAAAARDLAEKGARRNAASMFRAAIEIDPLNPDAAAGLGLALAADHQTAEALKMLRRARECGASEVEVLLAMGRCSAILKRRTAALGYFEEALAIEPRNFIARRAVRALGHEPHVDSAPAAASRIKRK